MAVDLIVEDNGKMRRKSDVDFADMIIKLKNQKDQWAVIEKLIERWVKTSPEETQALKIQIADHRELLDDKEFGQTKGGKAFGRRFTLVFPIKLQQMIRTLYSQEELEFDSAFYREFVKRYPNFKVAEKS
jgi:hypothetical protein